MNDTKHISAKPATAQTPIPFSVKVAEAFDSLRNPRGFGEDHQKTIELCNAAPQMFRELKAGIAVAIAVVSCWERGDLAGAVNSLEEWAADADMTIRHIAAAPETSAVRDKLKASNTELREALQAMNDAFAHYCEYGQQSDDETAALEKARAAIAEANRLDA